MSERIKIIPVPILSYIQIPIFYVILRQKNHLATCYPNICIYIFTCSYIIICWLDLEANLRFNFAIDLRGQFNLILCSISVDSVDCMILYTLILQYCQTQLTICNVVCSKLLADRLGFPYQFQFKIEFVLCNNTSNSIIVSYVRYQGTPHCIDVDT